MKLIISEKSSNNNVQPIDNLRNNVDSDTDSWSRNYLIDVLKQYLATYVLEIVNDKGESVTSRKYYDLAFELRLIGVLRPTPIYQIHRVDLTSRLLNELDALDPYSRSYVLHQAVGRIFEDINFELYHNSISRVMRGISIMIFQPDFRIKNLGNLIEINDGAAAVTIFTKDFSKTLETTINKIKQRQPDLFTKEEDLAYRCEDIEAQLIQIYVEYEKETELSIEYSEATYKHYRVYDMNTRVGVPTTE